MISDLFNAHTDIPTYLQVNTTAYKFFFFYFVKNLSFYLEKKKLQAKSKEVT